MGADTALLEGQQLLGAEGLVVDLRCRLDQVLQVRAREEVAQRHEFAVLLVLDYDAREQRCGERKGSKERA